MGGFYLVKLFTKASKFCGWLLSASSHIAPFFFYFACCPESNQCFEIVQLITEFANNTRNATYYRDFELPEPNFELN